MIVAGHSAGIVYFIYCIYLSLTETDLKIAI